MHVQLNAIIATLALLCGALWLFTPVYRSLLRPNWLLLGAALILEYIPRQPPWLGEVAMALAALVGVNVGATLLFRILLKRAGWPVILTDVAIVAGYAVVFLVLLVRVGVNVSGLIATSALLAAVVGLALQELLGNLIGGVAIHADGAIHEGVWIETPFGSGKVRNIRLRHTSIETTDGDVVIIPNSSLTKSAITVFAHQKRMKVRFRLGPEHRPTRVVQLVKDSLSAPLDGIADDPAPQCFISEFQANHVEYIVSVSITKPGQEEIIISCLLGRISYSLSRAGILVASVPKASELRPAPVDADEKRAAEIKVIRRIPIWSLLNDDELAILADRMKHVIFGPNESIVRQGEEGDSMFVLLRGSVSVVLNDGHGRMEQVATLGPGGFFGEMSLMTGDKRTATVIAVEEVESVELQKDSVADILQKRSELAREISTVLEKRQLELQAIREKFLASPQPAKPLDLLGRIQRWFSIELRMGASGPPA